MKKLKLDGGVIVTKQWRVILWAAAGIVLVIALVCGMEVWQEARAVDREAERLPELRNILTLAENKGADWATDELTIAHVDTFRKKSLYQKWGEPTGSSEAANEDVWLLSDQFQLTVYYNDRERAERVKVVPIT